MKIKVRDKEYVVIKEYENYYLCTYKNLYRTCFLKFDVHNNAITESNNVVHTSYTFRAKNTQLIEE